MAGWSFDAAGSWKPAIYHHDHVMSVTGISTHTGAVQEQIAYGAFGNVLSDTATATTNTLRYTGREADIDTGLYYYRARYYDNSIGRFISEDPLGFKAGINFYIYVGNNPVNYNDPSGKCFGPLVAACPAIIEGGIIAGKAVAGFVMGYIGAAATGTESTAGRVGAGVIGAIGLGGSDRIVQIAGSVTGLGKAGSTVVASGIFGSLGEGAAQAGDVISGSGQYNFPKIAGMGIATAGVSLLAGEASFAALMDGTGGLTAAASDTLGAIHTGLGSFAGSKIYDGLFPAAGVSAPLQGGFGDTPGMNTFAAGAAGGFLIYPNKSNTNQMRAVYAK